MRARQAIRGGAAGLQLLITGLALAAGHDDCGLCHGAGDPSAGNLLQPPTALCSGCHPARLAAGEHAVDVLVTDPNNSLPLRDGGLTCITCHDPHASGTALRQPEPQLCRNCHPH